MREFIEAVYEYPWTTFLIFVMVMSAISEFKD